MPCSDPVPKGFTPQSTAHLGLNDGPIKVRGKFSPVDKLLGGQTIALARLFEGEQPDFDRSNNEYLLAINPPPCIGRWKIGEC